MHRRPGPGGKGASPREKPRGWHPGPTCCTGMRSRQQRPRVEIRQLTAAGGASRPWAFPESAAAPRPEQVPACRGGCAPGRTMSTGGRLRSARCSSRRACARPGVRGRDRSPVRSGLCWRGCWVAPPPQGRPGGTVASCLHLAVQAAGQAGGPAHVENRCFHHFGSLLHSFAGCQFAARSSSRTGRSRSSWMGGMSCAVQVRSPGAAGKSDGASHVAPARPPAAVRHRSRPRLA